MTMRKVTTFLSRICCKIQQVSTAGSKLHTCSLSDSESRKNAFHVENFHEISSLERKSIQQHGFVLQQLYLNKLIPKIRNVHNPFCKITSPKNMLICRDPVKDYQLPTSSATNSRVILDISWSAFIKYHCPKSNFQVTFDLPKSSEPTAPMVDPGLDDSSEEGKQALKIHKRRKAKIRKKHRIKWNKKHVFMIRLNGKAKAKKQENIRTEKLQSYDQWKAEFSAEDHIMKCLKQARKGGFRAEIFSK